MLNEFTRPLLGFPYNQFSVGMDKVFHELENISNLNQPKYPPYNIVEKSDDMYVIELALAGFAKDEIQVEYYDSNVIIKSKDQPELKNNEKAVEYLHRGISKRKFERVFKISENIEISSVKMENGMLYIDLEKIIPENKKRRTMDIK
jgi:molecular chaperone IbpA